MDLILLRHGETPNNFKKVYNEFDTPLSEEGVFQVERAANKVKNMIIDRAIVSPLYRTRQTFEIINKYVDIPYTYDDRIVEIDAGKIKGHDFKFALDNFPKETEDYLFDYINNPLPGGESIREAYERAGDVLDDMKKASGNILMVTHGGFISLMLANVLGDPIFYTRFSIDNASFTVINIDRFIKIKYINRV